MNDIIIKINKLDRTVLPEKTIIGNDGENLQCRLVFEFEDDFVDGIGRIEYSNEDGKNYIWISKENNKYYLPIKDVVLQEGNVNFQLVITEEQTTEGIPLFKSNVFTLYCKESINAVDEAPEGYELWIDEANQIIMEMDRLNIDVDKIDGICYITLTDKEGNTKTVTVEDGNGIVTIEKTSTSGLVDTYTIIFTDGTTTTFQVTNGADGEVTLAQFEQAMMVYNALPKVSDTNTNITLNDTAKCPMNLDLKGNTYQAGTPTPDSPQTIQVVTGNNTITISNSDNSETQTLNINLGSIELCKIGNYQDYIYKSNDKWYLHKEIGKIVLDGSEAWGLAGASSTSPRRLYIRNGELFYKDSMSLLSDYFTPGLKDSQTDLSIWTQTQYLAITDKNSYWASASAFKTWLSNHNTTVYYELETPTNTEITNSTLITQLEAVKNAYSYDEQTNITQTNSELGFIISATAIRSLVNIFNGGA